MKNSRQREIEVLLIMAKDHDEIQSEQLRLQTISRVAQQREKYLTAKHENKVFKRVRNGAALTALLFAIAASSSPGFKQESIEDRLADEAGAAFAALYFAGSMQFLKQRARRLAINAALEARLLSKSINRPEDGWVTEELGKEAGPELSQIA